MTVWRNSPTGFGRISRALHWTMAVLMAAQLALGLGLMRMIPSLSNLWLYGLHKSLGISLLALALLRILWHRISPPPPPLGDAAHWTSRLARASHHMIYLLMLAIPISGWVGASGSGIDTVIFNRWTLPAIAPISEAWQDGGFAVHGALTKLLIALLALHVAGALRRGWARDGTIRRMTTGG